MRPLVSVIISFYNHQDYILRCLESVAGETYDNIELIMIDDGSSDHSFDIARAWGEKNADRFARFVLHRQQNIGLVRSLNRLLQISQGEFITPLASDDCLLPGGVEARVSALQQNPQWLAVFGDCLVVDKEDTVLHESGLSGFFSGSARKGALLDQKLMGIELAMRWSVPGPVFLMRSKTPAIVGTYDESLCVEDRDYYLRLITRGRLGFIDHPVACYRWHGANISSNPTFREVQLLSLTRASQKASREAQGLLRLVLWVDYYRRLSQEWRKKSGRKKFYECSINFAARVIWKCLNWIQDRRYRVQITSVGKN